MALLSILDREHSIAGEHYSRWLVPPAALAIHLSIGQAYAFSVFNLPLSQRIGVTHSAPGGLEAQHDRLGVQRRDRVPRSCRRRCSGPWLERVGPRKAMFVSALCFGGGFEVAALGVATHQFWLLLLGYGVLGGDRTRARLHLAGHDAHPVVSGPSGHGDRHGDHGVRRRRHDRVAAVDRAHGVLQDPRRCPASRRRS